MVRRRAFSTARSRFGGEESAGALVPVAATAASGRPTRTASSMNLLAAEMTARTGRDPGEHYRELTARIRRAAYTRGSMPRRHRRRRRNSPSSRRRPVTAPLARRRADRRAAHARARQRCRHRRAQGRRRERLVRSAAVGYREPLQALRGELPRRAPSAGDRRRGEADRRSRARDAGGSRMTDSSAVIAAGPVTSGLSRKVCQPPCSHCILRNGGRDRSDRLNPHPREAT